MLTVPMWRVPRLSELASLMSVCGSCPSLDSVSYLLPVTYNRLALKCFCKKLSYLIVPKTIIKWVNWTNPRWMIWGQTCKGAQVYLIHTTALVTLFGECMSAHSSEWSDTSCRKSSVGVVHIFSTFRFYERFCCSVMIEPTGFGAN